MAPFMIMEQPFAMGLSMERRPDLEVASRESSGGATLGLSLAVAVATSSGDVAVPPMLAGGLIAPEADAIIGGIVGFLDSNSH